ncbi:pentapeptide repeat-containing protein [Flavobacterium psychrotrophum]|uniref:pentapeptide repeat-containing protein n=1 Tax=Flavobacterium psychrotrophum TaxID=2294119 RepID=UPI000E3244B9|nr:pentapeptide repeat-containing protein [Flavobacterium psychrotrophum]
MADYIINKQYSGSIFFEREIIYHDFERCTFDDCDFSAVDFSGVAFIDCIFINCNFAKARINYVSFRDVQFTGCDFTEVNFVTVDKLLFKFAFKDCKLDYTKFYAFKMRNTLFENCSMIAVDFMEADITGSVFDNCNLHKSVFIDTTANKTDFSTAYNFTIDPEKNKLKKAIFTTEGLKGLLTKFDLVIK